MQTPRQIVRNAALAYGAGQLILALAFMHATEPKTLKLTAALIALWGPWLLLITWRRAVTAWQHLPPDDLRDVSFPTLYLLAAAGLALLAV